MTKTERHQAGKEHELPKGNGELILIAEDDKFVCEVTCSLLEAYGYGVLAAKNGAEALTMYSKNMQDISVVLMDMQMPVMDGEASIREIRRISSEARIIATSGLIEKDRFAEISEINVNAFLSKPYTSVKLLNTIHEVLSAK